MGKGCPVDTAYPKKVMRIGKAPNLDRLLGGYEAAPLPSYRPSPHQVGLEIRKSVARST